MKFYICEELDIAVTDLERDNLLIQEDEDFLENKGKYKELDIKYEIDDELTLKDLNDYVSKVTGDNPLESVQVAEVLEDKSIIYSLVDSAVATFDFDILEENEQDPIETKIKITDIRSY